MNETATSQNNAILITSCDKYSDLWEPFFAQFFANWPDCPYQVYLSSNKKRFETKFPVKNILTNDDPDWSSSYKKVLKEIKQENLFVWMEDALIVSKIDTDEFEGFFNLMIELNANHIHYRPVPKFDRLVSGNKKVGVYEKGCLYRVNAVGFWKKDYLNSLLLTGESPWNFEIMGSYRSSYNDGFYCLINQPFDWIHLIEKGSWRPEALKYCKKNNIKLELAKRKTLSGNRRISTLLKVTIFDWMINISWKKRLKILNFFRKMFASY